MIKILNVIEKVILTMTEIVMFTIGWLITFKYIVYYGIGNVFDVVSKDAYDVSMFIIWAFTTVISIIILIKGNIKLARKEIKRFEE